MSGQTHECEGVYRPNVDDREDTAVKKFLKENRIMLLVVMPLALIALVVLVARDRTGTETGGTTTRSAEVSAPAIRVVRRPTPKPASPSDLGITLEHAASSFSNIGFDFGSPGSANSAS